MGVVEHVIPNRSIVYSCSACAHRSRACQMLLVDSVAQRFCMDICVRLNTPKRVVVLPVDKEREERFDTAGLCLQQ